MQLLECIHAGFKELWSNKVRSFLSVLGIIIGIMALMAMMSIMAGVEENWVETIETLGGFNRATITSEIPLRDGKQEPDLQQDLTLRDVAAVKKIHLVRYAAAENKKYLYVGRNGTNRAHRTVIAGTRETLVINGEKLASGRGIADNDVSSKRNVCVLGTNYYKELFKPHENPLGKTIEINRQFFTVIGLLEENVLKRRGKNILDSKNNRIYIPITVMLHKFSKEAKIDSIPYVIYNRKDLLLAKRAVAKRIMQNHRHVEDIKIKTNEEHFLKVKESTKGLRISVSLIAGISLIVGGIGIMNIMIASVAQRVKEIGVRKAVGAKQKDILIQFLVESVLVSFLGGIIGILGSVIVVKCMGGAFAEITPIIKTDALLLSASFSVIVGICFGLYPAIKASKLDPIDALRYQ